MGVTATGIHFDVRGEGEPLLLLAGQANSRRWWAPVRDDFAARHRTVALDALGTGASTAPDRPAYGTRLSAADGDGASTAPDRAVYGTRPSAADGDGASAAPGGAEYSTRRFAADAVAALDAAGIGRAHVYGTSMGGKVAQWLAIDFPDRVGALVLGCTTAGGPRGLVAGRDVVGPLAGPAAAARRALAELMVSPGWLDRHPDGVDAVLGDPGMTQAARRGHRLASARHDASAALGRVGTPTLVLHGTDDAFCPVGNADLLVAGIPGAALRLFVGARHAYFLEHRAAASAAVLTHLATHPRA